MFEVFTELATASRAWMGDPPSGAMLGAMRAFLAAAATDESLVRAAAGALDRQEPGSIAWIAVAFGTLVERGIAAELTAPAVLDQLVSWLPALPAASGEGHEPPVPTPAEAIRLAQFQFLCQSAVTHLARLPARREAMGRDAALLARLDELHGYSYGAWWVREALVKSSGTLVLLHPSSGAGLRLAYTNVSNCFHLFSLLQTAVGASLPGGRAPDATIASVARGQSSEAVVDEAWWLYGRAASMMADPALAIPGTDDVRHLPRVDGEPVILLWPPAKPPAWDARFLGPHLEAMPADAVVERMLSPAEVQAWLAKLGSRRRKRWWPFREPGSASS